MADGGHASFPPVPASVPAARHWVVACLPPWLGRHLCEKVALLVSETVTNAVLHARTPVQVRVYDYRPTVRVEVDDDDDALPVITLGGPEAESGRGVFLVTAVADDWGTAPTPGPGKTVWFEVTDGHDAAEC